MKFILKIANLFNKPYRIQRLDYNGKPIVGQFDDGPLDCCRIDILLDSHCTVAELSSTKTLGALFTSKEHSMSFGDISAIADRVHGSFARPVDPLLVSSTHPRYANEPTTIDQATLFELVIPDANDISSAIRNTKSKRDAREISFISLVHRLPRATREAVAFD